MSRVLIFGLDSASFSLLTPWITTGELPNISKLMSRGIYGDLTSVKPPMSPSAWTSFVTGVNPGKHGIFDFTERKVDSYDVEFINGNWRKSDTIWKILSDSGKKVCSIAVPMSYPPEEINGVMISGIDTPGLAKQIANEDAFFPPEMHDEIRKHVGPYLISANIFAYENHQIDQIIKAVSKSCTRKFETAAYLLQKEPWDCMMLQIGETDAISHRFWRYHDMQCPFADSLYSQSGNVDPILQLYKLLDNQIGKLIKLVPEDSTIMIMSDHGMGGNVNRAVYLNKWLRKNNYLFFKNESISVSSSLNKLIYFGFNTIKQLGLKYTPANIKEFLLRRTNISSKLESAIRSFHLDWSKTVAFSEETPYFQNIWINQKDREPFGIVNQGDEYEEVRNKIIAELHQWLDPETDRKVVKKAYKREEIYSGPYVDKAADIIIDWNLQDGYSYMFKSTKSNLLDMNPIAPISKKEMEKVKSADHRDDGLIIISGPAVKNDKEIYGAQLIDLAPTILHLTGLSIPQSMDGNVLSSGLNELYSLENPVKLKHGKVEDQIPEKPIQGYTPKEEEMIRKRLEGLGYIE